jgi:hypothetical protein
MRVATHRQVSACDLPLLHPKAAPIAPDHITRPGGNRSLRYVAYGYKKAGSLDRSFVEAKIVENHRYATDTVR